jgi:hypothetical protein
VKLSGRVSKGSFVPDDQGQWLGALRVYENEHVIVEIEKPKRRRSGQANRYYRGQVLPIVAALLTEKLRDGGSDVTDVTPDEAHEACKRQFLGTELVGGLPLVRSTKLLTSAEFAKYVDDIRNHCALDGWYIPAPEERYDEVSA